VIKRISRNEFGSLQLLRKSSERRQKSQIIVPGIKCITELLSAGHSPDWLLLRPEKENQAQELLGAKHFNKLQNMDRIRFIKLHEESRLADQASPEGFIVVTQTPSQDSDVSQTSLILDSLNDPGNLGSIIRTAAWFGFDRIGLLGDCADVWSARTIRSSMGSVFHLTSIKNITQTELQDLGQKKRLLALDSNGGENLQGFCFKTNDVLVMGSESHGLKLAAENIGQRLHIPGKGNIESLNVGHAFAVCAWSMFSHKP
jgi:RNA methyltransferase, TrmH family